MGLKLTRWLKTYTICLPLGVALFVSRVVVLKQGWGSCKASSSNGRLKPSRFKKCQFSKARRHSKELTQSPFTTVMFALRVFDYNELKERLLGRSQSKTFWENGSQWLKRTFARADRLWNWNQRGRWSLTFWFLPAKQVQWCLWHSEGAWGRKLRRGRWGYWDLNLSKACY